MNRRQSLFAMLAAVVPLPTNPNPQIENDMEFEDFYGDIARALRDGDLGFLMDAHYFEGRSDSDREEHFGPDGEYMPRAEEVQNVEWHLKEDYTDFLSIADWEDEGPRPRWRVDPERWINALRTYEGSTVPHMFAASRVADKWRLVPIVRG